MDQRLMAFWKYDTYPFLLWGEVDKIDHNGNVQTKEYPHYRFPPVKVFDYDQGMVIAGQLEVLKNEYQSKLSEIGSEYGDKLNKILKKYGL